MVEKSYTIKRIRWQKMMFFFGNSYNDFHSTLKFRSWSRVMVKNSHGNKNVAASTLGLWTQTELLWVSAFDWFLGFRWMWFLNVLLAMCLFLESFLLEQQQWWFYFKSRVVCSFDGWSSRPVDQSQMSLSVSPVGLAQSMSGCHVRHGLCCSGWKWDFIWRFQRAKRLVSHSYRHTSAGSCLGPSDFAWPAKQCAECTAVRSATYNGGNCHHVEYYEIEYKIEYDCHHYSASCRLWVSEQLRPRWGCETAAETYLNFRSVFRK